MKSIDPALINCGTLVFGVRVERRDGFIFGWTQHDRDQTVEVLGDDLDLLANPGFNIQSFVGTAGLSVDNTEISLLAREDVMTRADILNRLWDGAKVFFFRYSHKDPTLGIIPVKRGSFGNFTPQLGQFKVEFRDLRQALQPNSTWLLQEGCRNRLGDNRCRKDLTAFTFNATVTAVGGAAVFTATALVQASDFFGEGELLWLTGDNANRRDKVKAFAAGVVTLSEAPIYAIQIGDTFTIIAGCRKRPTEDCVTKFDNILNFNGEKDKPTRDDLIKPGVPGS